LTSAAPNLLRDRLARRDWVVTVEAVTPAPADDRAHARIMTLADAVRADERVAALTLTDRTTALDADPVALAPAAAARSAKAPLVHLAGKGRDRADAEATLRRARDAGIASVLLTGGDPVSSPGARDSIDALELLRLGRAAAPELFPLAVLAPTPGRPVTEATARAAAKRDAGAAALIAQLSWDLDMRETMAAWQARLGLPVVGSVMLLTRGRLEFLAQHHITGVVVPPALRRRVEAGTIADATRRLALDVVLLRRLGYAGAHVSGVLDPARLAAMLDDADRLDATLGDDWRKGWREAAGIA
jgi:methylenetetrahydrofolate reductase (NADPH)